MAAVLRSRFADRPQVTVMERRFEDWSPPDGGCDLLYFALSWHWADPDHRVELAHRALRPGGTLALLSHQHGFADEALETKVHAVYERHAPHLRTRPFRAGPEVIEPLTDELTRTGRFGEVRSVTVTYDHPYPTARYLGLLRTFSPHLALAPARRRLLHDGIGAVIDANGGVLMLRLLTSVVLARSVAAQNHP
jgi:SAM-dependent methyltransferase